MSSKPFHEWLDCRRTRSDAIGELARSWKPGKVPDLGPYESWVAYFWRKNENAPAMRAVDEAWREWFSDVNPDGCPCKGTCCAFPNVFGEDIEGCSHWEYWDDCACDDNTAKGCVECGASCKCEV